MAFWNDPNVKILPKFRFSLDFGGFTIWWVKSAQFPKLSQEKGEVQSGFGGNVVYKPGPAKWQPITITMADMMIDKIAGMTTRRMSTQMFWFGLANILDDHQQEEGFFISNAQGIYDNGFDENFIENNLTIDGSKLALMEIKKQYGHDEDIETPDEKWILENIIISEIDFGGGEYSSDEINEITITLTYDIARPEYDFEGAGELFSSNEVEVKKNRQNITEKRKKKTSRIPTNTFKRN